MPTKKTESIKNNKIKNYPKRSQLLENDFIKDKCKLTFYPYANRYETEEEFLSHTYDNAKCIIYRKATDVRDSVRVLAEADIDSLYDIILHYLDLDITEQKINYRRSKIVQMTVDYLAFVCLDCYKDWIDVTIQDMEDRKVVNDKLSSLFQENELLVHVFATDPVFEFDMNGFADFPYTNHKLGSIPAFVKNTLMATQEEFDDVDRFEEYNEKIICEVEERVLRAVEDTKQAMAQAIDRSLKKRYSTKQDNNKSVSDKSGSKMKSDQEIAHYIVNKLAEETPRPEYVEDNISVEEKRSSRVKRESSGGTAVKKGSRKVTCQKKISPRVMREIQNWISTVSFESFYEEISARIIGQEQLKIILANVYNYFRNLAQNRKTNNNMILTAPSGCGKTETYRALKDYFNEYIPSVPVAQIDLTQITEEGYRGKNTKDVILPLFEHVSTYGVGLIFLDEFDKKMLPSFTSNGNNVNHAIQSQLLTLIEGIEYEDEKYGVVDTNNTLFVGLGSFDVCRERKETKPNGIGFLAEETPRADHYDRITRSDILELGGTSELIGRFPLVVNYHKLSEDAIDNIIDVMALELSEEYDCKIIIGQKMREQLHEAKDSKFGCREMDAKLRETLMEAYVDILLQTENYARSTVVLKEIGVAQIYEAEQAQGDA